MASKRDANRISISNLRVPPQSREAEMAFLGSVMLKQDVLYDLMDIITPDAFYFDKHKTVYETMLELFGKGEAIDLLTLTSRLKEKKMLDKVGGSAYLSELAEGVPSAANAPHYAGIIHKKSLMRRLIDASNHLSDLGYDESNDIETLLDQAEKKIYEVTNFNSTKKFKAMKDELNEAFERIDKLANSKEGLRGIPTGFKGLDNLLSGLQPADLIILAARPSAGKTALALDIARNTAVQHGTSVGIFSLEMSSQQLVDRMLASQAQVDSWKLRTGRLNQESEFDSIRQALDDLSKAPIYIDDQPANNILKMRSVARRLKSEKGLGLIVVDYLQLMSPTQTRASDNVVQQVTEISRSLKQLARELEVPVLALSQLSRAIESRGGRPRLSDLRDSGSIEQDADVVMFIHRERNEDDTGRANVTEILVEKHRNGPVGKVDLFFNDKKTTFQDVEKSDFGGADQDFDEF